MTYNESPDHKFQEADNILLLNINDEWEQEFFFAMKKDKCICIICFSSVALSKKANVERHFSAVHKQYENNYLLGTELRKAKVQHLMTQLKMQ